MSNQPPLGASTELDYDMEIVGWALNRLDTRRHVSAARMEFAARESGGWTAMLMADPLNCPVVGNGSTPADAIRSLTVAIDRMDWRRVRR